MCTRALFTQTVLTLVLQNCVWAIPNLNLPDVCTASPERGKAFCKEHCLLLQEKAPGVPLGLKDFLKYCGSSETGKAHLGPIGNENKHYDCHRYKFSVVHKSALYQQLLM